MGGCWVSRQEASGCRRVGWRSQTPAWAAAPGSQPCLKQHLRGGNRQLLLGTRVQAKQRFGSLQGSAGCKIPKSKKSAAYLMHACPAWLALVCPPPPFFKRRSLKTSILPLLPVKHLQESKTFYRSNVVCKLMMDVSLWAENCGASHFPESSGGGTGGLKGGAC